MIFSSLNSLPKRKKIRAKRQKKSRGFWFCPRGWMAFFQPLTSFFRPQTVPIRDSGSSEFKRSHHRPGGRSARTIIEETTMRSKPFFLVSFSVALMSLLGFWAIERTLKKKIQFDRGLGRSLTDVVWKVNWSRPIVVPVASFPPKNYPVVKFGTLSFSRFESGINFLPRQQRPRPFENWGVKMAFFSFLAWGDRFFAEMTLLTEKLAR